MGVGMRVSRGGSYVKKSEVAGRVMEARSKGLQSLWWWCVCEVKNTAFDEDVGGRGDQYAAQPGFGRRDSRLWGGSLLIFRKRRSENCWGIGASGKDLVGREVSRGQGDRKPRSRCKKTALTRQGLARDAVTSCSKLRLSVTQTVAEAPYGGKNSKVGCQVKTLSRPLGDESLTRSHVELSFTEAVHNPRDLVSSHSWPTSVTVILVSGSDTA
ncbi:hypothetical protein GOBAR_AA38438 [Gossypium barbadense]|uniref:Uncharacterized protein n=1 Tax=Gossypium barbadense TaxID=3634 RepID=A0A2P5VTW9_GOSBA|nr:hypothetical protein GOBAR_AA38438 [Gossypium barbadense]